MPGEPKILSLIVDSIEDGATVMREDEDEGEDER